MATTLHNPVTTKFHGLIGGIIYYVVHNQQRMRSRPSQVRNPRSTAQTAHRTRFAAANSVAALFNKVYPIGYRHADQHLDPRSAFVKHIYHSALNADAMLNPGHLAISKGSLQFFISTNVSYENPRLTLRWSFSHGNSSDRLCVCLYNHTRFASRFLPDIVSRGERRLSLSIPDDWRDDHIFVYCFWHNPDSNAVSTSVVATELNSPDNPDSAERDLSLHRLHISIRWKSYFRKRFIQALQQPQQPLDSALLGAPPYT